MASDSMQPKVPVDADEFREVVENQVRGALHDSVARTDLPPDRFVSEAIASRGEIDAEVGAQAAAVEDLRRRIAVWRRRQTIRVSSTAFGAFAVVVGALEPFFPFPDWVLAVAALGLGAAVFGPLLTALQKRRQEQSPSSSTDASPSQGSLPLSDQLSAAEAAYREGLERTVQRWITERANRELGSIYSATLPELDPEGLAEVDDSDYEIPTEAQEEIESAIRHMPGGSIGVSGPRGAGKTTLLWRATAQAWQKQPEKVRAAIVVDAPVEYEARDFVLHLFARLCEAVLGPERVEAMRSWEGGFGPSARPWPLRTLAAFPKYLGPVVFAIGAATYLSLLDAQGKLDPRDWEPLAITTMAVGGVLTYLTILASLPGLIRSLPNLRRRFRRRDGRLDLRAEQHLRQIWFQRTFSSGWSGALKVPIGVEVGAERGAQLAENQLSLPDVVSLYKGFARAVAREGQVRIGVDELDKMDDEMARRFLNEIKVIFRVSGCFYLVSVSEDAMAYFERRGLPFRDVFDSSFDDVMRVGYLVYADSRRLLRRRVVGLPSQFIALGHVLGGGLARDVIRAARDICEQKTDESLAAVTEALCMEQMDSKCVAARVAVRRLQDPAQVILLSQWLASVEASIADPADLLDRCRSFEAELATKLGPAPGDQEALKQHREAVSIALEVITFAYFVVTLRELMPTLGTPETARGALHNGSIDRLAKARQAFAINPAEAWEAVSAVRTYPLARKALGFPALGEEAAVA